MRSPIRPIISYGVVTAVLALKPKWSLKRRRTTTCVYLLYYRNLFLTENIMADSFKPPRLEKIPENVTLSDFSAWQSNLLYHLSVAKDYAPYLEAEWGKQGVI